MKRRDLIAHLHAQGCILIRERAKHTWYGNPMNSRRTAIPGHSEISDILCRKICRDLGANES